MNKNKYIFLLFRVVCFVGSALLIFSTSEGKDKLISAEKVVVFPPPPDTARIQFLTSISSSADVVDPPSFFKRYILGEEAKRPILKPYGITLSDGKIYVCDTMLPGLEIIDIKERTFEYFTPSGFGKLRKPINCALDSVGRLYVADASRCQIIVYSPERKFISTIDFTESGKPTDVQVYDNKLWVCDLGAHQIRVFDLRTNAGIRSFPEPAKNQPQYLFSPTNIEIYNGKVYVSDMGDARVKVFSLDGQFIASMGSFGKQPGNFVRPKGITVDDNGNLFVVDAAFENVQIFNERSELLMFIGGEAGSQGSLWLPAGIAVGAKNLDHFRQYLYPGFKLEYLIFVTNQYGPSKINIYGFIKDY